MPTVSLAGIEIRDPFVLPVKEEGKYYLYGTASWHGNMGFHAYVSTNLRDWRGPAVVMRPPEDFWADRDFWAPEVHARGGHYYLFATYARAHPIRGTQVAKASTPLGPFEPLGDGPQTPRDWQCLDGTLFFEDGQPWMVFCHEWTQVGDGEICAIRLSEDFSKSTGEAITLFRASEAPWAVSILPGDRKGLVTDGPWFHRAENGALWMLWSSFVTGGKYAIGLAKSAGGKLAGPWEQQPEPIFTGDGGHPMLFRTFEGQLAISFHQPNSAPSRPQFRKVREEGGTLVIGEALAD